MNGYPLKIIGITANKMVITAGEIEQDDNALVAQALKGRLGSFKELVSRYRNQAFFFARAMVGDPDDAYDLSQEAFIRVHRHLAKHAVLYLVPFRRTRGEMADGDLQPRFLGELGNLLLPQPKPVSVRPASVRDNQEPGGIWVCL